MGKKQKIPDEVHELGTPGLRDDSWRDATWLKLGRDKDILRRSSTTVEVQVHQCYMANTIMKARECPHTHSLKYNGLMPGLLSWMWHITIKILAIHVETACKLSLLPRDQPTNNSERSLMRKQAAQLRSVVEWATHAEFFRAEAHDAP